MRYVRTHKPAIAGAFIVAASVFSGCGALPVTPMPNALPNLTLEQLGEIQGDERLTDDEKRQAIRDAALIPNDAAGDRLVEFLLTLPT